MKIVKKPTACGGKKSKGSCGDWAGATTSQTNIKIAA